MKCLIRSTWFTLLAAGVVLPPAAWAQEATLGGVVTDSSGGVLPGVTVTAVHTATGNTFLAVTDEHGAFRVAVRTGKFQIQSVLPGFTTATRAVEVLVGQTAVMTVQLAPAAFEESVNVSGTAPLVDTASSALASNVDPRQMQDLPLNGRNFVDLTLLAPGSRQNAAGDELGGLGTFQINVDGQRVTQNQTAGFGQPKYSRDAIAEFEFVANRFDATQGGSSGAIVNAISKSGTNRFSGSHSGYFRNDRLVAKDFVQNRVLPYSDQQLSWTAGGPIAKNRTHFFANYEFEREPQTFSHSSPYPTFNFDLAGTRQERKGGGRVDHQFTPMTRLSVRGNASLVDMPYDARYTGGAVRHPSSAISTDRHSKDVSAMLTQVFSPALMNEVRGGYASYYWIQDSILPWANHPYPGLQYGTPIIQLRSYTIGQAHTNSHEDERQGTYNVRDNLTWSFSRHGRHDVKLGGEYAYQTNPVFLCNRCMGIYDAQGGPIPANVEQLFPVWNDISTWNLAALSPIVRSYTLGVGNMQAYAPLNIFSGWYQDDWKLSSHLTVNLGLRYDLETGTFAESIGLEPFLPAGRKNDTNNWGPRAGFAYALTDKTVVRGGGGKYFADPGSWLSYWTHLSVQALHPQVLNDGRADFAANPFNGPIPTFAQVEATLCTAVASANCLRRSINTLAAPSNEIPYSYQASAGMQHQFGSTMAFEADYVYSANRAMLANIDVNLAYNPETGLNYPFTNISRRPYPNWGTVQQRFSIGQSDYHALQMAFTKRLSHHWQASATYLLAGQWNLQNAPVQPGCQYVTTLDAAGRPVCDVPVTLNPVIAQERYLTGDQRHRVTFNGIWELPFGFQASGLYLFGDNGWGTPGAGVDTLGTGSSSASTSRLRADGTIIPRNSFDLPSIHRVDMRIQRRFRLGRIATIDGIVEMFNVLNHANFGSFTLIENNARNGKPADSTNIAYQPRMLQLGFRANF
ncbi:MAG: TonB-dependent receptor [Acidobacteriota bacterium]